MEFRLENPGEDFATLVISLGEDDSASAELGGGRGESGFRIPLYDYEARALAATLVGFPSDLDSPFPPLGTCILTGEPGEDPDDCCTHEHERIKG